jgi:hypothetical protein
MQDGSGRKARESEKELYELYEIVEEPSPASKTKSQQYGY